MRKSNHFINLVKISIYHRLNKNSSFEMIETKTFNEDFDVYFSRNVSFEVVAGECYFFEFDPNGNVAWDTVEFFFGTSFTKNNSSEIESPITKDDIGFHESVVWRDRYSNEQGKNNQFYCYGSPNKYALMTYKTTEYIDFPHWHGVEADQYVFEKYLNPGNYTGSMITWVAESSGRIKLYGYIRPIYDQSYQTDGVVASIYKNEELLYSYDFSNYKRAVILPSSLEDVFIQAGDHISFHVSSGKYFNSGWDGVNFRTNISYIEKDDKVLTKEEIKSTLHLSKYSEIRGVNHDEIIPEGSFSTPEKTNNTNSILIAIIISTTVLIFGMFVVILCTRRKKHES